VLEAGWEIDLGQVRKSIENGLMDYWNREEAFFCKLRISETRGAGIRH